ncbi:hypothetical protein FFLO_04082 [Filobasidium floriforme]|uniref:Uncharacterized protein n=1 Tax=Filobasidium floriforme TaxID=5210 RepID=A0A8K0NMP1_9TREE|nr:uncharacterized protein HD553DRAFT_63623 [Filobasidium floriforme]KAG7531856.1 hypothetical protein FFLO_04082 [Filobasidium floriforme]KAH8082675.1 hypothetical protein HD553DRAFT_63623 [Filobasidium floriforme]
MFLGKRVKAGQHIYQLSEEHTAVLLKLRGWAHTMDDGWPLHPISTSLPIAGPILIDLLIFYAIIRRISQLNLPRRMMWKAVLIYAITAVAAFVPGLGGVAIKFGKPSTRVVHEVESYLSLRCAIKWHQQLYGEEDFKNRLANAMCPKEGPMHIYRHLARDIIDYILHNRLPDPVAEKHSSVSAV